MTMSGNSVRVDSIILEWDVVSFL